MAYTDLKNVDELRHKLRVTRHQRGDTAQDVADQTHIAQSTVTNFENYPDKAIGFKVVINVCDYLDEDPEDYIR